jgi:hypothetical protein
MLQLNKGLLPEGYGRPLFHGAFRAGLKYGCNIIAQQSGLLTARYLSNLCNILEWPLITKIAAAYPQDYPQDLWIFFARLTTVKRYGGVDRKS